jgi:hypothetical protein
MADQKTKPTTQNVYEFIDTFASTDLKKKESRELVKIISDTTGFEAKMWGPSIIGFGRYHYTYTTGYDGNAPIIGFSPRKTAFSLYVYSPCASNDQLLKKLGKFKMEKACIYVKKLEDIDLAVLQQLIRITTDFIKDKYTTYEE